MIAGLLAVDKNNNPQQGCAHTASNKPTMAAIVRDSKRAETPQVIMETAGVALQSSALLDRTYKEPNSTQGVKRKRVYSEFEEEDDRKPLGKASLSVPDAILLPACTQNPQRYLDVRLGTYDAISAQVKEEKERLVGRYLLRDQIGQGSFGKVYAALSIFMEKVAIKKVDATGKTRNFISKLQQEAVLMNNHGHHPNIVPLFDAIYCHKVFYTIMPLATTDLHALLNCHSNIKAAQLDFMEQALTGVLSGLKHLHEHGVAHLDIKAENILLFTSALDKNKQLKPGCRIESSCFKITDFGVSKVSSNYGRYHNCPGNQPRPELAVPVTHVVGTSVWSAPELLLRKCCDGRLSDMWSFGCLIHRLLGFPPTCFDEAHALMKKNDLVGYANRLEQLERLMDAVQINIPIFFNKIALMHDLACKCLRIDPTQRITATEALEHRWFQ